MEAIRFEIAGLCIRLQFNMKNETDNVDFIF